MPSTPRPPASPTRALVPVLVGVTLVVSIVSSLGAPLLPDIARSLSVSLSSAQWSLTAALVAGAVSAPVLGRLGDGAHRREAILWTLAVVAAGGVLAAASESLAPLVAGRAMQGIGLGLAPITMAAARDHLPEQRGTAVIGLLSVCAAAGVGVGYPISGLVAETFDVHAAFLFGTVAAAVALVAAFFAVPSNRGAAPVPLDLPGAAVGSVGLVALLIGIGQGEAWGWGSPAVLGAFAVAAAVLAAWVRLQLRLRDPLVDLRQLRHRAVLGADFAAVILGVALYMFFTAVTEFVQTPAGEGFGFDATTLVSGLCLVPFSFFSLTASRVMPRVARVAGIRAVLAFGGLVIAAAGVFFALLHAALWQAFVTMALVGVGYGFTFAAIPGLIAGAVPGREVGSAMGFYQVARSIGFSVGSALVASLLAAHESGVGGFPAEEGYVVALWAAAGAGLLAACTAFLLPPAGEAGPAGFGLDDAELAEAGLPSYGSTGESAADGERDP